jgi:hypothetical protein
VKTFLTFWENDAEGNPTENPKSEESLRGAYELVKATPSVDIWSFGTILYALCVGKPLFPVDRDDDLENGSVMKELYEWNDSKMATKLRGVADPAARNLLSKLLKADPCQRLQNMDDVLNQPFFTLDDPTSHSEVLKEMKEANQKLDRIASVSDQILANTVQLTVLAKDTSLKLAQSTSSMLRAIIETADITAPTTFVILPHKLGEEGTSAGNGTLLESMLEIDKVSQLVSMAEQARLFVEDRQATQKRWEEHAKATLSSPSEIGDFVMKMGEQCSSFDKDATLQLMSESLTVQEMLGDPLAFGKKLVKEKLKSVRDKFHEKDSCWLYLVDEYHGTPVEGGVYPIKITKKSELAEKALPYMNMGVKAMKLGNGVAGLARVFGVPAPKVSEKWIAKVEKEVQLLDQESTVAEFDILAEALDNVGGEGPNESKTLRGSALKDLHAFILSKDKETTFGGLVRICDPNNGRVIWTTEEGRKDIEAKENVHSDNIQVAENARLLREQAAENARLLRKIETLELSAAQSSKLPGLLPSSDSVEPNVNNANGRMLNKDGALKVTAESPFASSPETVTIGSIDAAPSAEAGSRDRLAADIKNILEMQKAQVDIQKKAQLKMQKAQLELQQTQEILRTDISKMGAGLREARRLDSDINGGKSGVCTIS